MDFLSNYNKLFNIIIINISIYFPVITKKDHKIPMRLCNIFSHTEELMVIKNL